MLQAIILQDILIRHEAKKIIIFFIMLNILFSYQKFNVRNGIWSLTANNHSFYEFFLANKNIKCISWLLSKSLDALDITKRAEPLNPINIPNNFLDEIGSYLNRKSEKIVINKGIMAIQRPTNIVEKFTCAMAKIVNGNKFDKTATPMQNNQYLFGL